MLMQRKKKNINTNNKYKKNKITMPLELKLLPLGRVVKRMGSRRGLLTGERLALYLHYAEWNFPAGEEVKVDRSSRSR